MSLQSMIDDATADVAGAQTSTAAIVTKAESEARQALSVVIANRVADVALVLAAVGAVWVGHVL